MKKIISIIILFLASVAHSTTYHVRTDGHDTNCNGSADASSASAPNCAFLTVQKGVDTATTAGDVVNIHTGTYNEWVSSAASGTAGNLITIQADGTDNVQIGNGSGATKFTISHNYVRLTGIELNYPGGWSQEGILVTGSNNFIDNNRVYNGFMGNPGSYAISLIGDNNVVDNNILEGSTLTAAGTHTGANNAATLTDNTKSWSTDDRVGLRLFNQNKQASCTVTTNTGTTATCTLSGGADWDTGDPYTLGPTFFIVFYNEGDNNVYSNNIVRNVADVERVWDLYGDDGTITNNEVYNMLWSGYGGVHPDIFQVVDSATLTSKRWTIKNNYFHDLDSQIGINEMRAASTGDWIFYNNIFANITQRMMLAAHGTQIVNNTFFNVQSGDQNVVDYGTTSGLVFKNNVVIGGSTNANLGLFNRTNNGADNCSFSNNFYSLPMGSGYTARTAANINDDGDTNYINGGDPLFVAPYTDCINNTCDFSLQAGSPLTDNGATLGGTYKLDKLGNLRPDGAWDIGAYEYDGGAPVRSSGSPTGTLAAGTTSTTLSLSTDENATCKYGTVSGTAYADIANTFSTTGATSHSATISGLTNGSTYTYYVRCTDGTNPNLNDYTITFGVVNAVAATVTSTPASMAGAWR